MDDWSSIRNILIWLAISIILSLAFGGGVGPLTAGIVKGGAEAAGVDIGKKLVESAQAIGKRIQNVAEENKVRAVYSRPTGDYRSWCGIDPNGRTQCCAETSRRLVMEYRGHWDPYRYGGVTFWATCYRP